jgi:hypothetical protein
VWILFKTEHSRIQDVNAYETTSKCLERKTGTEMRATGLEDVSQKEVRRR